jgi:8-oxo-dGTP pyrophosphatase MutT (NUDIX family)
MHKAQSLDDIHACLGRRSPATATGVENVRASVALVVREKANELSLLFIRRALREGDRWSGHIAFPGGHRDGPHETLRQAAERETLEEVGLDLSAARALGRLDDLTGTSESIRVSGFVFGWEGEGALELNHEVDDAFWLPFDEVESPERHEQRGFDYRGSELHLPALRVLDGDGPLLWGLSYRFLELLMTATGRALPAMPWHADL